MRILAGRTPTAAVAVVATLSLGIASADRVNFDKGFDVQSFPRGNGAIITVNSSTDAPQQHVFGWTTTESFEIDTINLYVLNTTTGKSEQIGSGVNPNPGALSGILGNPSNDVPSGTVGSPTTSVRPGLGVTLSAPSVPTGTPFKIRAVALTGSVNDSNLQVVSTVNGGNVTINDVRKFADTHGMPLYFEAIWPSSSGRSYSRAFALVNSGDTSALASAIADDNFFNDKPFPGTTGGSSSTSAGGSETANPHISAPTTQAISAQGGGGLSTGAIAGIAVGAGVVGLALLATLVWFLLRRNQKPKHMAPLGPFGPGRTRTDELIAEKEANTGADASPHSPYSDDGAVLGGHGGGNRESDSLHHVGSGTAVAAAAAAVAVAPHHPAPSSPLQQARDVPRSYTPYSDRPSGGIPSPSTRAASLVAPESITASRGGMESPAPGRATPHGLPTQYAHLVEEGMTEDEIRRLEEEERQLDAAIEQAGRKP